MVNFSKPFRVGLVPINGFALMSYAAIVEPLRAANTLSGQTLYDVQSVETDGKASQSSGGDLLPRQIPLAQAPTFDLVLLAAAGNALDYENQRLAQWLRKISRTGTQIGGVSAAPLFLARNGLLDGRRMTIHWEHAEYLQEVAPEALFEPSLYVIDRDRLTCGGGTAPIDLMLALISNHHGQKLAQLVGDWFLHASIRPSAGPQRASLAERYSTVNSHVLAAIEAMETHVANPLSLQALAKIAGTSPRQLTRLFLAKVNTTPIAFGRKLRLSKANTLLQTASLSVSEIAFMTGFSSPAHFSSLYVKEYGSAPSHVRGRAEISNLFPTSKQSVD
jgi:transcriptional regulator GlxA family with amidase domain